MMARGDLADAGADESNSLVVGKSTGRLAVSILRDFVPQDSCDTAERLFQHHSFVGFGGDYGYLGVLLLCYLD